MGRLLSRSFWRHKIVERLAAMPDRRGIKVLIRLNDKIYSYMLAAVKISEGSTFHPKHRVTDLHAFFTEGVRRGDRVLDVGCNLGHIAAAVASKAEHVTALDIRPDVVERAKGLFPLPNVSFVACDFLQYDPPESSDVVIASNVLEHVSDRSGFLAKCRSIAPRLLVRVPAIDRDWMVPYRRELGLEWRLHPDHEIEYSEETLRQELERAGYAVLRIFERFGAVHCVAESSDRK